MSARIARWVSVVAAVVAAATGCRANGQGLPDHGPGATDNWSAQAQAGIAAGEYAPQADGEHFRVTNRAQNLRADFGTNGPTIQRRDGTGEVGLSLRAWGREGATMVVDTVPPEEGPCLEGGAVDAFGECLHRVDYARPGLTEWWENRAAGLEQGLTVTAPPDGEGVLVFELALTGALADVEEDEALLVRETGEPLRYAKLSAWDARGRALPAWMEETDDGLRVVVDDEGAIGNVTVDPLLTTAAWTAEGGQAYAEFGRSVASAGDVNGDGFGDVVVGARAYDNGEVDEGRAYVYLGSPTGLATTAAWTAESDQADAQFGNAVASAGDVNGDGYGDVVVGANAYDNGETAEGRAYVYLGSSSGLVASAEWMAESNQTDEGFGGSVASAGDVNGDGYADVVVGADGYTNGEAYEGRAYVYLGSSSGLTTDAAWTAESDKAYGHLGGSVASAGDVNGDGYGDLVVGAYGHSNGESSEGRVYVYLGSSVGVETSAAWTAESDQAGAEFGWSAASAGDANGDGYGDLVVGAFVYDDGESNEGRAYVYLGSSSGLATSAAWTAESDQANAYFGYSVASAGDVNGDGYGDVVVGACDYSNGSAYEGLAYMYLGSSSGLATNAAWTAESNQTAASFGCSVASAGDVNGDGFGDVVVGARLYDNGDSNEGQATVYLGSSSSLATSTAWTGESDQAGANLGYSVASAGDVNGDGYGDVVVGAPTYDNGEVDEGRAYVYLGSSSGLTTSAAWTAEPDQDEAGFGLPVASAGDVNGDGYGDVMVGARFYDNGESNEGRAYLFLGSPVGVATSAAWTAESDQAEANFGVSVASAGDVNGDGYGDVIVGAWFFDNGDPGEGRAYVYFGSPSGLATEAVQTVEPDLAGAEFGYSVASAGDVNGDGYGDVVVGALGYKNGEATEGSAYVYIGSSSGVVPSAAWMAESDQASAYFGASVASAGDVNGDGYGDVVVGANCYENGESDEGRAYLYLGSSSGLASSAAWTAEPDQTSAYFGSSVASAGDVNADGYGDVVVGAFHYDHGSTDDGQAYVYLGSSAGLASSAAWTAASDHVIAQFGRSVASAGDVNGDGYGDLVIGDPQYGNGSSAEGAAFLYLGNGGDGTTPLSLAPQARQSGTTTPISPGLSSTSASTFDVSMGTARDAWGMGQVKLQVEAKPLGTVFDGTDLTTSAAFVSSGLTGAAIQQEIAGLTGATGYHWRARVLASPAEGRPQGWGPWVYGGLSGNAQGGHVYTLSTSFYADADGDGYGDAADGLTSRDPSVSGYVTDATDCDDASAATHPAATETVADGIDQDCDGVDSCYTDADGDSYGTSVVSDGSSLSCATGDGATNDSDCDDASPTLYPGAPEIVADGIDQDCDGADSCYTDADGDNYGTAVVSDGSSLDCATGTGATVPTDCDDAEASINPGVTEQPGDEIDQDCDDTELCYVDADNDGYTADSPAIVTSDDLICDGPGEASTGTPDGDCDDTDAAYSPGAVESDCEDPNDYNCDGAVGSVDADGDGFSACEECDDGTASVNPDATELCDDIDDDCDGTIDADAIDAETWYADADRDTYTDPDRSVVACDAPPGYIAASAEPDCDDADAPSHPGGVDLPGDGLDQDCDGADAAAPDVDKGGCGCASDAAPAGWPLVGIAMVWTILGSRRRSAAAAAAHRNLEPRRRPSLGD